MVVGFVDGILYIFMYMLIYAHEQIELVNGRFNKTPVMGKSFVFIKILLLSVIMRCVK